MIIRSVGAVMDIFGKAHYIIIVFLLTLSSELPNSTEFSITESCKVKVCLLAYVTKAPTY